MAQTSSFVFDKNLPVNTGPSPDATVVQSDSTLDNIFNTAGDVGNVFTQIDKVLHPEKYQPQPTQPAQQTQQSQHAGFGWTKWLLIAAVGGTALYYGKEALQNKKGQK